MSFRKPVNANVTQRFGADFLLNGRWYYKQTLGYNGHNGDDYAAPVGTPVYAADEGTVVFEGWGQHHGWMGTPAGICVLIHHGGTYTGYAHLNSTTVNKGQWIGKGQVIGYVGNTGAATGPHLHFEALPLHPNFTNGFAGRIDPMPYMDAPKNLATVEQIKQAFRDILERDVDGDALQHYQKYAIDFVRSDLASSIEYRDLQARKVTAAKLAEQQRIAKQQQLEAEKRAAEERARIEAERLKQEAEAARIKAEQEATRVAEELTKEAERKRLEELSKESITDPFHIPGVTPETPSQPAEPPKEQGNSLVRFLFHIVLTLFKKK